MMSSPSDAAVRAAWQAYDKQVWADAGGKDKARDACMRVAIEAAAKVDGVEWPER